MRLRVSTLVITLFALLLWFHAVQAQTVPSAGEVNRTANLRGGPGTNFPVVGSATAGTTVQIAACNDDCSWYQLSTGEWVAAFLVDVTTALVPTATPAANRSSSGPTLTIVSWNVESGGALQNVVSDRIAAFDGVDIWGLSEVNAIDAES